MKQNGQSIVKSDLTEFDIQASFIEWSDWQAIQDPRFRCIYAIPNGSYRGSDREKAINVARKLKRAGLRAGVPDICIAHPCGEYPGAYIEFKAPGGKMSPMQLDWCERLLTAGYAYRICTSTDEAIEFVKGYFGGTV